MNTMQPAAQRHSPRAGHPKFLQRDAAILDESYEDYDGEFDSDTSEVERMIALNGMIGLDADAFLADAS